MFEGWTQDNIDEHLSKPRNKYQYYLALLAQDPKWYEWSAQDRLKKQKVMNELWKNWDQEQSWDDFKAEFISRMGT